MNYYPIRTISELTGVATTTLRAWERRYGLLKPERTAKGHRLYSAKDVDFVKEIVRLLKQGHTISEAVRILKDPGQEAATGSPPAAHWDSYQQAMLKAIEGFNAAKLDREYSDALSLYPIDMVTKHVIIPVLDELGERWLYRDTGIAEEHFFSAFLRNKLGARLHHESHRTSGCRILVSCLPDEYHELGILLFSMAAISHGYQILYLGTNMPPSQLSLVAQRSNVSSILISGTRANQWSDKLEADLRRCVKSVEIPVMFGGNFSETNKEKIEKIGAHVLGSEHVSALQKLEAIIPVFSNK